MTPQLGLFDHFDHDRRKERDAVLSPCGVYRYTLRRTWNHDIAPTAFLMLNPSKADALVDDPTIKRCVGFAKRWGAGGIVVVNLYAYRATDPRFLAVGNPVLPANAQGIIGPDNDRHLRQTLAVVDNVVCAWGAFPFAKERAHEVLAMIPAGVEVTCLGNTTKDGSPRHPLYLAADTKRVPFGLPNTYPTAGITGPGQWGSRDGLAWECVPDGQLIIQPGGFCMGRIVTKPEHAREAMREGLEGVVST